MAITHNIIIVLPKELFYRAFLEPLFSGWLKECRRIFSRFEKAAKNFDGMIRMAFIQRSPRLAVK